MEIIAEKINGARKPIAQAIRERNSNTIQQIALDQAQAGADWIDVNAGTHSQNEPDDLVWLVETVQQTTDLPLCLDSVNPLAIERGIACASKIPMINSISGEQERLEHILPLAVKYSCPVIALALDSHQVPPTSHERLQVVRKVIQQTREGGLPDHKVYVDPLVMAIATNTSSGKVTLQTIEAVHDEFPEVHISLGISNVSFGLPVRSKLNQAFIVLAIERGLDCAILDVLDRDMRAAILSAELILDKDRHCQNFTRAFRTGKIGDV